MNVPKLKPINVWCGNIETKDEALLVIRSGYALFYCLGVFFILVGLLTALGLLKVPALESILVGVMWVGLAFLLQNFHRRIVAAILILLSIGTVYMVIGVAGGKIDILLLPVVLLLWPSIRVLRTTIKWQKWEREMREPQ